MDVYITYEDYTDDSYSLRYNRALAKEYLGYLNSMAEEFHLENDIRVSTLSRYPVFFVKRTLGLTGKNHPPGMRKACGRQGQ